MMAAEIAAALGDARQTWDSTVTPIKLLRRWNFEH